MFPLYDDNPQIRKPIATYIIIGLTLAVWIFVQGASSGAVCEFALIPQQIISPPANTQCSSLNIGLGSLLTHAVLHGGWFHILTNLWMLYVFGNNVEDTMGVLRFVIFYLLCAVISGLIFTFLTIDPYLPLVGASGAISGVMAGYVFIYPKAKITTFLPFGIAYFFLRLPSWAVVGYWSLLQVVNLEIISGDASYVAYSAHFGGLVAGAILIQIFKDTDLVNQHPYAGWAASVPESDISIPKVFKYLNYLFILVVFFAVLM